MHDSQETDAGSAVDRRGFLGMLAVGLTGLATLGGAIVSAVYAVAPALKSGAADGAGWSPVDGAVSDFTAPARQTVAVVSDAGWAKTHVTQAVFLDRVEVISTYDQVVHSPSFEMRLPSVVSLKQFVVQDRPPAFTRQIQVRLVTLPPRQTPA